MYVAADTWSAIGALIAGAVTAIGWWIRKTHGANAEKEFNRILKRAFLTWLALIAVVVAVALIYWGTGASE
jgi:hypothetical protein